MPRRRAIGSAKSIANGASTQVIEVVKKSAGVMLRYDSSLVNWPEQR